MGYITYNVLTAALMIELFPDCDAICYLTKSTQREFVTWFCEWLKRALRGALIYNPPIDTAETRADMLKGLRLPSVNGKVSTKVPPKIKTLAELLSDSPTLTRGAARYLHPAREDTMRKYMILKGSELKYSRNLFTKEISPADRLYIRFGQLSIEECDVKKPLDLRQPRSSLAWHPSLKERKFQLEPPLTYEKLLEEAARRQRSQMDGVLEWCRLNMHLAEAFFIAIRDCPHFGKTYRNYYDVVRIMFQSRK